MSEQIIKQEAAQCIRDDQGVIKLAQCLSGHFPDLEIFRENDDLVIKGGGRFLIVRRTGPDSFGVSENVAVPSTNLVDSGGGAERNISQLVDEIAELARG